MVKKIAVFLSVWDEEYGGGVISTKKILENLSNKEDVIIEVYTSSKNKKLGSYQIKKNYTVNIISNDRKNYFLKLIKNINKILSKEYNILYSSCFIGLLFTIILKKIKKDYNPINIFHLRIKNIDFIKDYLLKSKELDIILTNNKDLIRRLNKSNIKNVTYLPNGINLNINFNKLCINKKQKGKITILYCGRIEEEKGVFILFHAVKKILENNKNVILKYVGCGSQLEKLKKLIKENKLEKNIYCLGFKKNEDLIKEYLNSDIFVFPSYAKYETFGNVLLEAAITENIIISNKIGIAEEIIENEINGFLIDINNKKNKEKIKILYETLLKAINLSDEKKEIFKKRIKNKVMNKYNWEKITDEIYKIIDNKLR